jgi:predicted ArsR family transcriptional regulator
VLEKVLRMISAEGTASTDTLAGRLGVSHALMQNMLEDLTRQGYLKTVADECPISCDACRLHTACLFPGRARIWILSSKGERLLARRENDQSASAS